MPKVFGKEMPPVMIGAMAVLAIGLLYTALVPAEDAPTTSRIKPANKKAAPKPGTFTEEDYTIRFASLNEPVKNSFKPLVMRDAGSKAGPSSLPTRFTGGGNWVYTGMAEVNGVSQGLLENRDTGDAEFVAKGQRWKQSTITAIRDDSITLVGINGESFTMNVGTESELPKSTNVNTQSAVGPVNIPGNLMGEIGIQPRDRNNSGWGGGGRGRDRGMSQGNLEEEE